MCFGMCTHVPCMEDLWESIPSFDHVGSRDGTQVLGLGGKTLFLINHLTSLSVPSKTRPVPQFSNDKIQSS